MKIKITFPDRLEDLPNIGKNLAADLRALGILRPEDLARSKALDVFEKLKPIMKNRHDPCVLYTLLSVQHFQKKDEALPWWNFTTAGKKLLKR